MIFFVSRSRIFGAAFLLGALPGLGACSMYSEGNISPNRIQVEETKFAEQIPVSDMDSATVAGLARHYDKHGSGPVDLTVTYDPKSSTNTAMTASNEAARIVTAFRKEGVRDVSANILPVKDGGDEGTAVISFTAYNALAPKDCTVMEGLNTTQITVQPDYKLGCTMDTVFARQIARPKDLNGQGAGATSDGRPASNIVEVYRTGAPNEPLEGETASED